LSILSKIFLSTVLFASFISAQNIQPSNDDGFPLITNYSPKEYSANVQNWAVIQDNRGVLYFGNVSGVLEYDGVNWRLINIPNDVVRCFAIDKDGKIYVGGISEIGYLAPDSIGTLNYVSLNKYIFNEKVNYGDVWSIIVHKNGLYFQTFSTLYLLESNKNNEQLFFDRITKNPSLKKWESRTRMNPIFSIGERLFVHERNLGLQELSNGSLKLLPGGEEFAQDLICIMLPYPARKEKISNTADKILIGSLRRGLFLFDGDKFEKFKNEADNYLIEKRLYFNGALLRDGSYALGTQLGGIVIIDKDGKQKKIINKNIGLNNDTVWDVFCDREGNIWAALDNGIAKIIYPSALQIIDEKSGFEGSIQAIKSFEDKIYIATSSGVYYLQNLSGNSADNKFIQLKDISVQSWNFLSLKDKLLAATNDGVFEVKNNEASLVDHDLRYAYCFSNSKSDESIIYVGLHSGLGILKYENDKLTYLGAAADINNSIVKIEEDLNGDLWCNDIAGKIIYVKTPVDKINLNGYKKSHLINENLLGSKATLFKHNQNIFYYNNKNIFGYDYQKNKYIPSGILKEIISDTLQSLINIHSDENNIIWCITNNQGKIEITKIDKSVEPISKITHSLLGLIDEDLSSGYVSIQFYVPKDMAGIIFVSSGNTLVKYNLDSELSFNSTYNNVPLIRKVSLNGKNNIFAGYSDGMGGDREILTKIGYTTNSIFFEYSLTSFLNESGNDYQYKLEGFNNDWSVWTNQTKKEYTNLQSGEYSFKVRSRNAVGQLSDEAVYSFRVLPPWYKTWWANLIGFLIVLLFINYVIRFRVRYLKNKNIVLEKLVSERTAKINEQKEILEKQAHKLLELDQIKSNFFANISHEFRTPLTLIKGQLENVLRIVKDETVKKKINIAFNNSNRLNRLINQVLDLSKLESDKMKLEFETTDIVSMLKNRVASFDSLAVQNKILMKFESKIESLLLNIDKEKIEEVIDNLLSNALKFTPPNGNISIVLDHEKAEFTASAVITISDDGIGIAQEKLANIFDRFYQADSSSTKKYEGTGLGLSIVKEIVELHGGSVTVSSKINKGTSFTLYLPVDEWETKSLEINETQSANKNKDEENKSLILIVEDNFEVRSFIKENLENKYRIEEAENGEEGINKAIEKIPDLIITDVMMPKVNGFELCNKLKNDHRTSHIPLVILTAKADEEDKIDGLQIGADEFLAKPFSSRELEIRVGNLIHIRQLLREKYKEISVIKSEDINVNPIDKDFLEKVFQLIRDHLEDQQFSVQKLADDMAMSVSQLNRKLNALINQSAGKLIRSTKLDYAAKLLEKNAGNITEIGYRIGFSDLPSFTNSFKEKFGISPSEYLKQRK
jgi:signal transduction histidine kinase/DNA-binding response OmpR family regulator